jgi:hypothetical protein
VPIGVTALCPGIIATNLFRGSRNRPARLREDDADGTADGGADQVAGLPRDRDAAAGHEMRERMHATLAAGMPPAEVAAKLVDAVRTGTRYLLTDHDWDPRIQERHESIMACATGPPVPVRSGEPQETVPDGRRTSGAADG